MDQRGFNDTSEDFISFKSRVLSFEGRDGPAISEIDGDVGAKGNSKRHRTWHGVSKEVNWGYAKANETARKLGYTGASVVWFLGVTTSLVNRYAASGDLLELRRDI